LAVLSADAVQVRVISILLRSIIMTWSFMSRSSHRDQLQFFKAPFPRKTLLLRLLLLLLLVSCM
jgi:hypothetical protein